MASISQADLAAVTSPAAEGPVAAASNGACPDTDVEPGCGVGDDGVVREAILSLEWLRSAPPDVAAAFLMSVEGQLVLLSHCQFGAA